MAPILKHEFYYRQTYISGRLIKTLNSPRMLPEHRSKIGMLLSQFLDEHYIVLIGEEKFILRYDEFRLL